MAPALWIAAALMGPCLGSFATTAALRRTSAEQALWGRSHCDQCGASLSYLKTVPLLSYIGLRGACATCGGRIDISHFAGEVAGGVIVLSALFVPSPIRAGLLAVMGFVLLASAVYDLKTQQLPDELTAVVGVCGIILGFLQSAHTLGVGIACALVSFALLEGVRRGFVWLRSKPGLGFGDVKLITALALWLGIETPWAVALACVLGLAAAFWPSAQGRMAFGPWLAVGAWCVGLTREVGAWPSLT